MLKWIKTKLQQPSRQALAAFLAFDLVFCFFHIEIGRAMDVLHISGKARMISTPSGGSGGDILKVQKAKWAVKLVDSFEPEIGAAKHAFDGNPNTAWITEFTARAPEYPHTLIISLPKEVKALGIIYTPRQDSAVGRISEYRVDTAKHEGEWDRNVIKGVFEEGAEPVTLNFTRPRDVQFIRILGFSSLDGSTTAAVGEIDLITRAGWGGQSAAAQAKKKSKGGK